MAKQFKSLPRVSAMRNGPTGSVIRSMDTLQNLVMGMATEKDKLFNTHFLHTEIPREQLNAAYRGDWIARKTIDIPPFDATREWRSWQAKSNQLTKIENLEKNLGLQIKVKKAMQMARLYGGGVIVMGIGKNARPDEPLELDSVKENDLRYLHVCNRYEITAGPIIKDVESPWYDEPEYYERQGKLGFVRIHPSRVVRMCGLPILDEGMAATAAGWGDSVLQVTNEAIRAAGLVINAVAQLVAESKMDVISIPGLAAQLASAGSNAYSGRLSERFSLANIMKSIYSVLIIDKDEQWERHNVSLVGLPDALKMYLLIASGAADIPATRMLSQSPAGLSATGESDLRNHYDRVRVIQTTEMQPELKRLDDVLLRSALGSKNPDDLFYNWNPLWQMDDKEKTAISYQKAQILQIDVNAGLLDRNVLKQARENQLIEDGVYPGFEQTLEELDGTAEEDEINQGENDPFAEEIDPNNPDEGDEGDGTQGAQGKTNKPPRRKAANDFNPYHESAGTPIGGRFAQTPPGQAPAMTDDRTAYDKFVADTLDGRKISDEEKTSIEYYSDSGYAALNQQLRDNMERSKRGRGVNDTIDKLDEVLAEVAIPKSIIAYRTASPRTADMLTNMKNGDLLWDEGYTSVSATEQSVQKFIKSDRGGVGAVIEVHLPKGAKALPIAHLSTRPNENEILVARRSVYSVHSKADGSKYLRLEKTL